MDWSGVDTLKNTELPSGAMARSRSLIDVDTTPGAKTEISDGTVSIKSVKGVSTEPVHRVSRIKIAAMRRAKVQEPGRLYIPAEHRTGFEIVINGPFPKRHTCSKVLFQCTVDISSLFFIERSVFICNVDLCLI